MGPKSVGYRIAEESLCFGGNVYTLTDYAILMGKLKILQAFTTSGIDRKLSKDSTLSKYLCRASVQLFYLT